MQTSAADPREQVITSHQTADFDALAAAAAAKTLYGGGQIVLGGVAPDVRSFLSLHKDVLDPRQLTDIDIAAVKRLIVVDTRRASRLRHVRELLARAGSGDIEVHVYDHHEASEDDIQATTEVVEPIGAATTLLVERIREKGIQLTGFEATLFALGIHVDTGSFSYARTNARDLAACAWLYAQGCELAVLNRYLRPSFDAAQRAVLEQLLSALQVERYGGVPVAMAVVALEGHIAELAPVVMEALALSSSVALFAVFDVGGGRLQVIARGRSPLVHVGRILKLMGGGGHPGAASASLKGMSVADVCRTIADELGADPPRPQRIGDVMSRPVHTLPAQIPLNQAKQELLRWGHTGAPVLRDDRLVGIISRRDIERAERGERADLPISSCMAHAVKTATLDEPLSAALERMVQADIGRLPVLDGEHLVGIVSRSDLLRALYGNSTGFDA